MCKNWNYNWRVRNQPFQTLLWPASDSDAPLFDHSKSSCPWRLSVHEPGPEWIEYPVASGRFALSFFALHIHVDSRGDNLRRWSRITVVSGCFDTWILVPEIILVDRSIWSWTFGGIFLAVGWLGCGRVQMLRDRWYWKCSWDWPRLWIDRDILRVYVCRRLQRMQCVAFRGLFCLKVVVLFICSFGSHC